MGDIWVTILGYSLPIDRDGFPVVGELIKKERVKNHLTQAQLAELLDCSRSQVAQMETNSNDKVPYETRRQLIKILGTAPIAFGLANVPAAATPVYNSTILQTTLNLYRDLYFSTGIPGGLSEVNSTIENVVAFSKSVEHKDRTILNTLAQFYQLGIDVAREEGKTKKAASYAKSAFSIANVFNDNQMKAAILLRHSSALYEVGRYAESCQMADEILVYIDKVPRSVEGSIYINALFPRAASGGKGALALADKALKIAKQNPKDEDKNYLKLTVSYAESSRAFALMHTGNSAEALAILDRAEDGTDLKHIRRMAAIKLRKAEALSNLNQFEESAGELYYALEYSSSINSKIHLPRQKIVLSSLEGSKVGKTTMVRQLRLKMPQV